MKILYTLFLAYSLSFGIIALPYQSLSMKLTQNDLKLQSLREIRTLISPIGDYSTRIEDLKSYADSLLEKEKLDKKEQKEYLKRLRSLDAEYQHLLYTIRNTLHKSIEDQNFAQFHQIIDADIQELLDHNVIRSKSIEFYKKHKSKYYSEVLENEIELQKKVEETKKKEAEYLAKLEAEKIKQEKTAIFSRTTNTRNLSKEGATPVSASLLKSSKLDANKKDIRESKFTRWLSQREYQERFDNGYYKQDNIYSAYVEMDKNGNRRVLEIPYEPKFYWITNSGMSFKDFKKNNALRVLNGKKLISLFIYEFDGIKLYTGTWISKEYFEREVAKLKQFGIHSPQL
ncbi:MAG: hypothetical protein RBR54_08475 [Sulfurimonas sp.]|jgi:hypothetical protein|nr:hypothetical protein [Sulfurimonas sp.]